MISHNEILKRFSRKYRFTLMAPATFYLSSDFPDLPEKWESPGADGKVWLTLEGRVARIPLGYSWNGCSPRPLGKYGIWWLGTPDFPSTINASLLHDALYQHLDAPGFPLTRRQCDEAFLQVMQWHRFPLARIYAGAVMLCGGVHRKLTKAA
jgi:hypothetical protein